MIGTNEIGYAKIPGDLSGPSGEVYLTGQDTRGNRCDVTVPWEWLDEDRNILAVRGLLNFEPADLIAEAERLNVWQRSTVVGADQASRRDIYQRNTHEFAVRGWHRNGDPHGLPRHWPALAPHEAGLIAAGSAAAILYANINPHARVTRDEGYRLLRYREGEQFGEHIDAVQGHPVLGHRRLSLLIYLNGGDELDGGETVFTKQCISVKPEPGLAVLFPSGMTHPHVGSTVAAGTKYVIVSWFS